MLAALRGERLVRSLVGLAVVVALTIAACAAVLSLVDAPVGVARAVVVLGGAAVLLGFLVGPILVGTMDQLDPRRFTVFGVDERQMPWILGLAALVSVPSLALVALGVCVVVLAVELGTPWPVATLSGLVGLVSTVLVARIGMAMNALLLPERRSRELTALFTLAVVVVAFPVAVFLASLEWDGRVPASVAAAASVLGVTPLGATPAFTLAVAAGDVSGAWVSGIVAVVTAAGLWMLWSWLVRRLLTTTDRPVTARERSGLGWFALLPSNAFGAIAARSLVYWLRDRRYIVNVVVVPVAGVLTVFPLLIAGVPLEVAALVPVPVMALFFGWLPHNDVAYDSTAFWTHVASGVSGLADRLGRLVPVSLIAVPVLAVAIPITLAVTGSWHLLLPLTGVAASLFLAGLGLSCISSVVSPYAVSHPGDSPFQQPQRSASRGSFGQAGAFIGAIALSAPTIWLFATTSAQGSSGIAAFWTGLLTGIGVLAIGAAVGGRIYDSGGERLMEFVETA